MATNVLLLLILSLCWSAGYLFVDDADRGLAPLTGTAIMCSLAAAFLLATVGALRRPLLATLKERPTTLILMGLSAIALPQLSDVAGQTAMGPDVASLVGTIVPVFTFILTAFVLRSRPYSNRRGLGVLTALAGLAIFLLWDGAEAALGSLRGALVMASGGLIFAINGVIVERITRKLDPLAVGAWSVAFGALWMIVLALSVEGALSELPPREALLGAFGDGVISIGLAFLLYYLLLGRAGADFAALYAYVVPILGIGLAVVFAGEPLTVGHALGLAVVMLGIWLLAGGRKETAMSAQEAGAG